MTTTEAVAALVDNGGQLGENDSATWSAIRSVASDDGELYGAFGDLLNSAGQSGTAATCEQDDRHRGRYKAPQAALIAGVNA